MHSAKHPMVRLGSYSAEADWENKLPRALQSVWSRLGASPAGRLLALLAVFCVAALSIAMPSISVVATVTTGALLGPAAAPEIRKHEESIKGSYARSIMASMAVGAYLGLMVWFGTTTISLGLRIIG